VHLIKIPNYLPASKVTGGHSTTPKLTNQPAPKPAPGL